MTSKQLRITSDLLNSPLYKMSVGFDRLFDEMFANPAFSANASGYPPYNVAKITEGDKIAYEIVLAVAGFTENDIEIKVEHDQLIIHGQSPALDNTIPEGVTHEFLHKGIAERKFTRSLKLDKDVVVQGATLENGLLKIVLERVVPEEKKPKLIPINKNL